MPGWIRIAAVSDCPPGEAREILAGGRVVALYNVDGRFYALDGVCSHQGGPLGRATLDGCVAACPWHDWRFDVRTGRLEGSPAFAQATFPVKVKGDEVFVQLDEPDDG